MKYTQAYPEQIRVRDSQWGSCPIKVLFCSRGVPSIVMMPPREAERRPIWNLLTPGGPTLTGDHFHLHPPRSCPSWFSSALWCPCSTTSGWCSGSLERYLDWKGLGDRCRAGLFQGQSLTCLLSRFFQVLLSLYQDAPPPPILFYWNAQNPTCFHGGKAISGTSISHYFFKSKTWRQQVRQLPGKAALFLHPGCPPAPYTE